ncbi:hypothetical protein ON010_g13425 [Phytophthora cinnamomi]|nr:hypothetical protein ON010_g13425 [Phytophthora cinnamomi]
MQRDLQYGPEIGYQGFRIEHRAAESAAEVGGTWLMSRAAVSIIAVINTVTRDTAVRDPEVECQRDRGQSRAGLSDPVTVETREPGNRKYSPPKLDATLPLKTAEHCLVDAFSQKQVLFLLYGVQVEAAVASAESRVVQEGERASAPVECHENMGGRP